MLELVRVAECILKHHDAHQIILFGVEPEAIVCSRCNWILQKQNEEWNVKQTFR